MILDGAYNSELGGVVPMLEGAQNLIKFNRIQSVNPCGFETGAAPPPSGCIMVSLLVLVSSFKQPKHSQQRQNQLYLNLTLVLSSNL